MAGNILFSIKDTKSSFNMSEFARTTLLKRYAKRDKNGIYQEFTAEEIFHRVASDLARPDVIYALHKNGYLGRGEKKFDVSKYLIGENKITNPSNFLDFWIGKFKNHDDYNTIRDNLVSSFNSDIKKFYDVMINKLFLPAGRTMANAGGAGKIVANCVVLNINDSLTEGSDSIMGTLHDAAALQNQGSGIGFNFSSLRPHGSSTKNTQASGPISFIKMYNEVFKAVKQSNRHGANMAVFNIDHPEILEFIRCKEQEGNISAFNVSVGITDKFLKQATNKNHPKFNVPWLCIWNNKKIRPYYINETGDHEYPGYTASEILYLICKYSWRNGEPGIVFLDEVNRKNVLPGLGPIKACNPCGL